MRQIVSERRGSGGALQVKEGVNNVVHTIGLPFPFSFSSFSVRYSYISIYLNSRIPNNHHNVNRLSLNGSLNEICCQHRNLNACEDSTSKKIIEFFFFSVHLPALCQPTPTGQQQQQQQHNYSHV
jgi:hypothetical protein